MKAVLYLSLLTCVLTTSLCQTECSASSQDLESRRIAVSRPDLLHRSVGPEISKSSTDTFYLYGGPGTTEGQFQNLPGSPGGIPEEQGWISIDLTEQTPHWQASSQLSSSVGDGNPEGFTGEFGNHGVISHHDGGDYVGYGNHWDDWLEFRFEVDALDPDFDSETDTTSVRLVCEYKHFLEPLYDHLWFERNRAGVYQTLFSVDESSYNDLTGRYEKRDFDSEDHGGIVYLPGDYVAVSGGPDNPVYGIGLRIRVSSDSSFSDEDGLFPSMGLGAAALDNIHVYVNDQHVSLANFEHLAVVGAPSTKDDLPEGSIEGHDNGMGPGTYGWVPTPTYFVGDFAKLYGSFQDIDPCRSNLTPLFGFLNDGTGPNNCPTCPISPATSPTWSYGIPGGFVVEFNGGLSGGNQALRNEIWSPPIAMDLSGPQDDVANGGLVLGFTRYTHLPLTNGLFAVWHVRYREPGQEWSDWKDNNFIYYSEIPFWSNHVKDISEHIPPTADQVQIALGVVDMAADFGFPGSDATPSPLYDNVYLKKYRIGGPIITAREVDLAQDCFPIDGTLGGSCRFDAVVSDHDALTPGDSIVVTILPGIPGAELYDPEVGGRLSVAHLANPEFAFERSAALAALGTIATTFDPRTGWPIYSYAVDGERARDRWGQTIEGRYAFDLFDGISNGLPHIQGEPDWIFPGDVIHYRIESHTNTGHSGFLPSGASGMNDFGPSTAWPREFTMRALPTVVAGTHPQILFWNDAGHGAGENEYVQAFRELCLFEGTSMDTYTTRAPASRQSNGLGSAGFRGATAQQLAGYEVLIYALGNYSGVSISDGSGDYNNDLSNDLGTLEGWLGQDADRYHAYFGDDFALTMDVQGAASQSYLNNILGVGFLSDDVGPVIGTQLTPLVAPTSMGSDAFISGHVANGGCLLINDFDQIQPTGGASVMAHEFLDPGAFPYPSRVAASVENQRLDGLGNIRHSIVFPYDLSFVEAPVGGEFSGLIGRTELLQQVLWAFGRVGGCGLAVEDPIDLPDAALKFFVRQNHPNPFNPRTRIEFSQPLPGKVRITLYNVRGEKVATLLNEARDAGPGFVDWQGLDDRGAEVSSGVYLYKVEAAGREVIKKMALLR